jgi:hypothetical protein
MKIINPISEMEKVLMKQDVDFEPVSFAKPHGYLRCKDGSGAIWFLHPESLGLTPYDSRWPTDSVHVNYRYSDS